MTAADVLKLCTGRLWRGAVLIKRPKRIVNYNTEKLISRTRRIEEIVLRRHQDWIWKSKNLLRDQLYYRPCTIIENFNWITRNANWNSNDTTMLENDFELRANNKKRKNKIWFLCFCDWIDCGLQRSRSDNHRKTDDRTYYLRRTVYVVCSMYNFIIIINCIRTKTSSVRF